MVTVKLYCLIWMIGCCNSNLHTLAYLVPPLLIPLTMVMSTDLLIIKGRRGPVGLFVCNPSHGAKGRRFETQSFLFFRRDDSMLLLMPETIWRAAGCKMQQDASRRHGIIRRRKAGAARRERKAGRRIRNEEYKKKSDGSKNILIKWLTPWTVMKNVERCRPASTEYNTPNASN